MISYIATPDSNYIRISIRIGCNKILRLEKVLKNQASAI